MTTDVLPYWVHEPVTAEEYDSWPEERCRDIEIVNGKVDVTPSPSPLHNRVARVLANAIDAGAGEGWHADSDFDVRLRDVPLLNRRPDVILYRAEAIERTPMRAEDIQLLVEIVSPGSETTVRKVKPDEYAAAGVEYYWRVEQVGSGVPVVHTHVLDPTAHVYRPTEVFTGIVNAIAPFPVEIDLRDV